MLRADNHFQVKIQRCPPSFWLAAASFRVFPQKFPSSRVRTEEIRVRLPVARRRRHSSDTCTRRGRVICVGTNFVFKSACPSPEGLSEAGCSALPHVKRAPCSVTCVRHMRDPRFRSERQTRRDCEGVCLSDRTVKGVSKSGLRRHSRHTDTSHTDSTAVEWEGPAQAVITRALAARKAPISVGTSLSVSSLWPSLLCFLAQCQDGPRPRPDAAYR